MSEYVKCYRGNHDGVNSGLIIANSYTKAAEIAGCSVYNFKQYWHIGAWPDFNTIPFKLYIRKMLSNDEWVEVKP